jgi:cation diffusion facilitator CzcD-associated flavoprotein CzcO
MNDYPFTRKADAIVIGAGNGGLAAGRGSCKERFKAADT